MGSGGYDGSVENHDKETKSVDQSLAWNDRMPQQFVSARLRNCQSLAERTNFGEWSNAYYSNIAQIFYRNMAFASACSTENFRALDTLRLLP